MLNEIILTLGQIAIIAALGLLGALFYKNSFNIKWFLGSLTLYFVYSAFLTRGFYFLDPWPASAQWNWFGKGMSTIAMLLIAAHSLFRYRPCGLTLQQAKGSGIAFIVLLLFSAFFFYLAIPGAEGRSNWETIAFQWTMPGLDEEIFYRGVLLLAMNEAFSVRHRILGAPISFGGILTSVLFGVGHALDYGQSGFGFDINTFLITGVPSLLLLWLREKTGSLLMPIVAHNVANGASTLF